MAETITDQELYRGVKDLLHGKAKELLDSGQLTLRVMRKLLEERFGIAEGSLDSKKKAISAILKQALEIEPENAVEAAATPAKAPSVNPGAPSGGVGIHKENRKPKSANGSEKVSKMAVREKKSKKAEAEEPVGRNGGSKSRGKDNAKARQASKRSARDEDSLDEDSEGSSGSEEDDTSKRQKKRARKTHPRSPDPAEREGAGGAKSGKSVTSRSIDMMKEVCKRATIKIAPTLYTRNKTVPELEAALSELLARHGLNAHSRDKEIGAVRRQLERARDLEGIDTSNIISLGGSRPRRAAAAAVSFRDMFKRTKVDSDEEEEEEEEERQAGKRKRGSVSRGKAAGMDEEEEKKEDGSEPQDEEESEGSGKEEEEAAGPLSKRKGTDADKVKGKSGRHRRKRGESDEDAEDADKESEDLVDVVHEPTKTRCQAGNKNVKSRDATDREAVQEDLEDSEEAQEVIPAAAKKAQNPGGRANKARRTIVDDDDDDSEGEHEEASSSEEEVNDDDSNFTAYDSE